MNQILYRNQCKCNEEFSIVKKRKRKPRSEGRPLQYPKTEEILSKTFHIKYQNTLSLKAKFLFNSFQKKYIYYAIDDILYFLNSIERDQILAILYSPIISLQNNFAVNFFDIWIHEIFVTQVYKSNKFFQNKQKDSKNYNLITLKFFYKTKIVSKKQDSLW